MTAPSWKEETHTIQGFGRHVHFYVNGVGVMQRLHSSNYSTIVHMNGTDLTSTLGPFDICGCVVRASCLGDYMSAANIVRRYQTIERVVNGTFSMQKEWMLSRGMPWNEEEVGAPSPAWSLCCTTAV